MPQPKKFSHYRTIKPVKTPEAFMWHVVNEDSKHVASFHDQGDASCFVAAVGLKDMLLEVSDNPPPSFNEMVDDIMAHVKQKWTKES